MLHIRQRCRAVVGKYQRPSAVFAEKNALGIGRKVPKRTRGGRGGDKWGSDSDDSLDRQKIVTILCVFLEGE